jgi:hypothetical protein
MPGDRSDDELARTATAPGSTSAPAAAAPDLGPTLGRYRLERALGEGGMGVVHAAFDPDLERRVAIKVLRATDGGGDEARQRLLREARAMARLTHPNVVTVHEVGTASGRDFVAMELIDGETLADWLRAARRGRREIVAAFVAAGRGLAAAHAAGLVHRDFKPHNVLRRRDGRICVTDFGLARGVDAEVALEATLRLAKQTAKPENTPSALSGLTATGSVLGTPAYMAPEQWSGGTVGPAADQFAFCVALWEALTGERPFRGATLDALKAEVQRGPGALDVSQLPRRTRSVLRRGLDPDPAKRWRDMGALLHELERGTRVPRAPVYAASAVIVAAAVVFALRHGGSEAGGSCPRAARDVDEVWSKDAAAAFAAAGRGELRDAIDKDVAAWREQREQVCSGAPDKRAAQLACLDGALARLELVRQGLEHVTGEVPADAVLQLLVEPIVCAVATPPRLSIAPSPDMLTAFTFAIEARRGDDRSKVKAADVAAFAARAGLEPCARAQALLAQYNLEDDKQRATGNDLLAAAEACGDDRLRADALIEEAPLEAELPVIGPKGRAAIERAKAAIDRVSQADLVAALDLQRAEALAQEQHWDDALAVAAGAKAALAARGRGRGELIAMLMEIGIHFRRASEPDMKQARALCESGEKLARARHFDHILRTFEENDAYAMWFLGDQMGAHAELLRLYQPKADPRIATQPLEGTVVDEAGKPIAGAIVTAATFVFADSVGPLPFIPGQTDLRFATSDLQGHFAIADAPVKGGMIAQLGERRAFGAIERNVKLVLHGSRHVAGKVDLGDVPAPRVFVMIVPSGPQAALYRLITPVQHDGSFELNAVPADKLSISVAKWGADAANDLVFTSLPQEGEVRGLQLAAVRGGGRTLEVVTRSTVQISLDGAQIFVIPGRHAFKTVGDVFHKSRTELSHMQVRYARPIVGEAIPEVAVGKTRAGDLLAHFDGVPEGEVTACAIGMSGDFHDAELMRKINDHQSELEVKCATAGPHDQVIVVEAPPQKRFD